jgi:hypothetical protein
MNAIARFSALSIVLGIVSAAAMADAAAPDPNSIYIAAVTTAGTGCPTGSVVTNLVTDTSNPAQPSGTIQFSFSDFEALIGPGTVLSDRTKNCNIAVTLHVPSGITLAQIGAQYNGYGQVDDGVDAKQTSSYYFANPLGPTRVAQEATTFSNASPGTDWDPISGNYARNDEFLEGSLVWSPCGVNAIANIDTRVSLSYDQHATAAQRDPNTGSTGIISLDTASFGAKQVFHFQWATCP